MSSRFFKFIFGFGILCIIQLICLFVVKNTHLMLPAPILGLIVFALLLQFNILKKEWIEDICEFLLKYLPVLFVPFLVGIISHFDLIGKNLLLLTINIFITTAITLVVTALFVENVIKFVRLKKIKDMKND